MTAGAAAATLGVSDLPPRQEKPRPRASFRSPVADRRELRHAAGDGRRDRKSAVRPETSGSCSCTPFSVSRASFRFRSASDSPPARRRLTFTRDCSIKMRMRSRRHGGRDSTTAGCTGGSTWPCSETSSSASSRLGWSRRLRMRQRQSDVAPLVGSGAPIRSSTHLSSLIPQGSIPVPPPPRFSSFPHGLILPWRGPGGCVRFRLS